MKMCKISSDEVKNAVKMCMLSFVVMAFFANKGFESVSDYAFLFIYITLIALLTKDSFISKGICACVSINITLLLSI